jgi:hypothetical protein
VKILLVYPEFPDTFNIIPRIGLESLQEGYRRILNQINEPQFYYDRVLTFLGEYQPPKIKVHFET